MRRVIDVFCLYGYGPGQRSGYSGPVYCRACNLNDSNDYDALIDPLDNNNQY